MNGQKRHFPYHSVVPEVELKRHNVSDVTPGFERIQPAVFEAPAGFDDVEVRFFGRPIPSTGSWLPL